MKDELDNAPTEDESGTEELDCTFALELETTGDELDPPTDELEDLTTEDELFPSDSELLFPLSLPQEEKIRVSTIVPSNAIRCFCFIFSLPLNHPQSRNYHSR